MQDFYNPKIGDAAPNFTVPSTRGKDVTLKEFRGKDVVLFFYPHDDPSASTAEACSFRDRESDLSKAGAVVLGISTDSLDSHLQFRDKNRLNFPLLSDATADVSKMYGVWTETNLSGRRTWGAAQATFWIGADGRIKRIYRNLDPVKHAGQVLMDMAAKKK